MGREQIGAVVLAAGRSTRFRSARSKLVHELGGRPIIDWVLRALREADVAPIIMVVAPGAEDLRALCGPDVQFAVQQTPRGTGHAVLAARSALARFTGDVLVLNGDLPLLRAATLRRMIDTQRQAGGGLTLLTATVDDPHGWGRVVRLTGAVAGIVEERDASPAERAIQEVNVGVYCARAPRLFEWLGRVTPDNAQAEIYLTDVVACAVADGVEVSAVTVDAAEVGQINSRQELAAMEKTVRTEIVTRWMEAGVTFEDPATAYVGPEVVIGRDTVVGPNVQLRGRTTLGEGCRLDGTAAIVDSRIGDRTHLRLGVVITEAEVAADCMIGPFAHLRPKTRLAAGVHIGDFVETKNAALGPGSKANHLAYLGDAEIGREVNIGAGTITCNYDGFAKHRTVIGDRVQVGSDTTIVAPLQIGDDAYIATATTVRDDVPAGGVLVFNPRTQAARPGWVARFRAQQGGSRARSTTSTKSPRQPGGAKSRGKTRSPRKIKRGR